MEGSWTEGAESNPASRVLDGTSSSYALESSPARVNPAAFYSDNEIRVRLPETVVLAWTTTEQVSIDGEQTLDDGEKLSIRRFHTPPP